MIIDAHIHISDPSWIPPRLQMFYARRAAYGRWPHRDPLDLLPRVGLGLADPDGAYTIAQMDEHGIDVMVPMIMDKAIEVGEEAEVPFPAAVERIAGLTQRYPGRLYAFIGVDPRRAGGLDLFRKSVLEWGFKGLKLYPGSGFFPYEEVCYPYYELCMELGVPVAFHTSPAAAPSVSRFTHPMYISDLHRDFPDLPIIYAHAGHGAWWEEAAYLAKGHPLGYLELSQWAEDARKDPAGFVVKLGRMRDVVGAHRIIWASDFSFGRQNAGERSPLPRWLRTIQDLPRLGGEHGVRFTEDEVQLMVGGNAQRLLKIEGTGA